MLTRQERMRSITNHRQSPLRPPSECRHIEELPDSEIIRRIREELASCGTPFLKRFEHEVLFSWLIPVDIYKSSASPLGLVQREGHCTVTTSLRLSIRHKSSNIHHRVVSALVVDDSAIGLGHLTVPSVDGDQISRLWVIQQSLTRDQESKSSFVPSLQLRFRIDL